MKGIAEADAKPASFASQLVDLASLRRTTKPKKNSRSIKNISPFYAAKNLKAKACTPKN